MKKLLLTLLVAVLAMPVFAQTTTAIDMPGSALSSEIPGDDPLTPLDQAKSFGSGSAVGYLAGFFNVDGVASTGYVDFPGRSYVSFESASMVSKVAFNISKLDITKLQHVELTIYSSTEAGVMGSATSVKGVDVSSSFKVSSGAQVVTVDLSKYISSLSAGKYLYSFEFQFAEGASSDGALFGLTGLVLTAKASASLDWNSNYESEYEVTFGGKMPTWPTVKATPSRMKFTYVAYADDGTNVDDVVKVNSSNGTVEIVGVGTAHIHAVATYAANSSLSSVASAMGGKDVYSESYTIVVAPATASLSWGTGHTTFFYTSDKLELGSVNYPTPTNPKNVKLKYRLQKAINGVEIDATSGALTFTDAFAPASNGTDVTVVAEFDNNNYNPASTSMILTINPNATWSAVESYDVVYPGTSFKAPTATLKNDELRGTEEDLKYESDKPAVAVVDPTTGAVTIKGVGTAIIKATAGLTTLTYQLNVSKGTATLTFLGESVEVTEKGTVAAPVLRKTPADVQVEYVVDPKDKDIASVNATTGEVKGLKAGTATVTAMIVDDNYEGIDATFTVTVIPAYNEGTLNLTFANTTTNLNGDARLVSSADKMYVGSTGVTRSNGKFVVADNAKITLEAATLGYMYRYLTIDADTPVSYTVKATSQSSTSLLATQTETVTNQSKSETEFDMQPRMFYTINFTKGGSVNSIVFETDPSAVAIDNDVKVNAIVANKVVGSGLMADVTLTSVELGGSFTAADLFGQEGKGGQNVRLYFTDITEGTVYFAFGTTGSLVTEGANKWQLQTGKDAFKMNDNGDYTVKFDNFSPENFSASSAVSSEKNEGVFTPYVPNTLINLQTSTNLNYMVKKGNVLSDIKTITFSGVTGIEDIVADEEAGEAVYYNLQGVKIANPVRGQVYVRVIGKKADKVVF